MEENEVLVKIRKLCKERGYSIYRLSIESGVSESTINSMFYKNNYPSIPTLYKICNGLRITVSDFFLVEHNSEYISDELQVIIKKANKLSTHKVNCLNSYIDGLMTD